MRLLQGLSYREKLFVYVSFFFILFNAFPLFEDLIPIPAQYVCIITTICLALLYPNALLHKAVRYFSLFIVILSVNGILGRYIHINGLANYALPLPWRLLIEIAWILPSLLIMSTLNILNNSKLYKILGYGSVIVITISFLYILPILTNNSNILRAAMHEENLDFAKPFGLPNYTLMHAYTFMLPGLCLLAKVNTGKNRIIMIIVIALFYYVITQTAVSTSITLGTLIIIASILYNHNHKDKTIISFLCVGGLFVAIYYSGLILNIIDGIMPFFEGTAVQFKLEDLHDSIVGGVLQGDSFEGREALHNISKDSFFANPIFGGGRAGGHSQMLDILGTVGIIGFIPFFLVIWNSLKSYLRPLSNDLARLYMFVSFTVSFVYIYHKGIFGATGWLFMCVIAPCLIMAIYYDYLDSHL